MVDDDPSKVGHEIAAGVPVLGGLDALVDHPDCAVVVCAGKGATRAAIVGRLDALGVTEDRYAVLVHPSVDVPAGCVVGAGSVLLAGVVLTADVTVGRHVVCMPHVVLTHDCVAEDYATLCAGVLLGGTVRVGRAAYVGMGVSVREGLSIGRDAVLGMGAVVLSDVPDGETWIGVPARPR